MAEETIAKYTKKAKKLSQIVTVFLTTHRRPAYLRLMIQSILKQTYTNFQLIVLDNVSGDETASVVASFADDRVLYIERESTHEAGGSNFEYAFSVCATKYLCVFHDDDIVHPDYLEKMLNVMEENDYCLLSSSYNVIDPNGSVISKAVETGRVVTYRGKEKLMSLYCGRNDEIPQPLFPTVLYRCSFFVDHPGFYSYEAGPSVDEYVYLQAERFGGVLATLDCALYDYRYHAQQDSQLSRITMGMTLLRFLFLDNYYANVLVSIPAPLHDKVVVYCLRAMKSYNSHQISRRDLKAVYESIPKQLWGYKPNRVVFRALRLSLLFPKLTVWVVNRHLSKSRK